MFISMRNQPHQNMPRLQTHFWRQNSEILTLQPEAWFSQIYLFLVHSTTHTHHSISMPVLESEKHTHKHSPHPLARVHFSFTCCNQQLCVSTRKAENSSGIAHTHILLSLTRIPLCNIIPVFWAQYYNLHSNILFRRFFEAFH